MDLSLWWSSFLAILTPDVLLFNIAGVFSVLLSVLYRVFLLLWQLPF